MLFYTFSRHVSTFLVRLSDTNIYLVTPATPVALSNAHFPGLCQTSWHDGNTQPYASANLLNYITMDLIFVNKILICLSNKITGFIILVFGIVKKIQIK